MQSISPQRALALDNILSEALRKKKIGEFPCHDLYAKESYEEVLKMMEEALKW